MQNQTIQYGSEQNDKSITLKKLFLSISVVLFITIIFSGTTAIASYKNELILIAAGICVITFIVSNLKFRMLNITAFIWLLVICLMTAGALNSCNPKISIQYTLVYIACFIAMITQFDKDDYIFFIKASETVSLIFVISIILSVFIPQLFTDYLSFVFASADRTQLISKELTNGIYSGLSGEKAEAAYVANIFIATQICRMFINKKPDIKHIILMLIGFLALMLTGKRTLLIIPVLALIAFTLLNRIKGKYIKFILFGFGAICAVYFLILFVPQASVAFDRLFSSSDNVLTGRDRLWNVCLDMFKSNPLFGKGFATFNHYANMDYYVGRMCIQQGIDEWTVQAHNIYYQYLGELGLTGFIPAVGIIAFTFIRTILLKKQIPLMDSSQKLIYHFSLYIQLWFIVYGFTGNVGHYTQDLIMYFICVGMYLYLQITFRTKNQERSLSGKDFDYENRIGNISKSY